MNAIEINNLSFRYQNEKSNNGFQIDIPTWSVSKGDFTSLLGPNGCGKSTLLRLISSLHTPLSGSICIDGKNISELNRRELAKKIAYVPQTSFSLYPFSVYEIVMMGRTPYLNMMGFENKIDMEIVEEAISLMQIEHLRQKGINELSGGEAQRVFIARALAQKAEIILLDEPNAHLDIEHQIMIFDILQKLNNEQNITIVSVSHDLNLVGIYSKNIAFMVDGKIVTNGNKLEVLSEQNIEKIFRINSAVYSAENSSALNVLIQPLLKNKTK